MRQSPPGPRRRAMTRRPILVPIGRLATALVLAAWVASAGCGRQSSGDAAKAGLSDNSGLSLPPGFKPVDLPVETRKQIFREAQRVRALAVQEANAKLPMDESHLPIGDTPAFDKRVADHKAIIDGILKTNLAALAERHKISTADLAKIEEEASRLRWTPPEEPEAPAPEAPPYTEPATAKPAEAQSGEAPAKAPPEDAKTSESAKPPEK